jgi:hypothetical protein
MSNAGEESEELGLVVLGADRSVLGYRCRVVV